MKLSTTLHTLLAFVLISCTNSTSNDSAHSVTKQEIVTPKIDQKNSHSLAPGAQLMENSDCYTCHAQDEMLIGPSFKEIALKYTNDKNAINTLSDKIIKGGSGNWGKVPMQGHPTLTKPEAESMVTFILQTIDKEPGQD